jgi:hypothetical protein
MDSSYIASSCGPCEGSNILQNLNKNKIQGDLEVPAQGTSLSLNTVVMTATSIDWCGSDRGHRYPTMIDRLPDGVLLEVFDICAYWWAIFVHICR